MDGSEDRKGLHVLSEPAGLISITAAVVLLVTSLTALAGEPEPVSSITVESVVEQINLHRAEYGLLPLRPDERLELAAGDRMRDMELAGYWAHISPDGTSPFVWLAERGYRHAIAGENLAVGFETASLLVESWMESPGHRDNILSPEFSDVGVAWIDGGTSGRMSGRSVVVLFARESEKTTAPVSTAGSGKLDRS